MSHIVAILYDETGREIDRVALDKVEETYYTLPKNGRPMFQVGDTLRIERVDTAD
jgi:hypothetical protein